MWTERFSEGADPISAIEPQSVNATTVNSTVYGDMQRYHRAVAILHVGAIGDTITVDFQIEQATASDGTGAKAITDKSITQLTTENDNAIVVIELRSDELDSENGFTFAGIEVTTANGAVILSAVLYGIVPRYSPVPTTNWQEIVD